MHYTIISCSPQAENKSTSALISKAMQQGLINHTNDTADIYYLNNKANWQNVKKAFINNTNLIFVMPLYVEGIPGLFMEFLETLPAKEHKDTTLSFVIQGGFEEASQLRTAQHYLEQLPEYLNCYYGGTLIKGGMFGMATMRGKKFRDTMCKEFEWIMKDYKASHGFTTEVTNQFAGREYYSKAMIWLATLTKPLNRIVWSMTARKMKVEGKLTNRPYEVN